MQKAVIFDLDGTLYRASEPIPHAKEAIENLLNQNVSIRYLTNNSAAIPQNITKKLNAMGIPCENHWVYSSGKSATQTAIHQGLKTVFIVGEPELHQLANEAGLKIVDSNADVVIAGICRTFTYDLLNQAMQNILGGSAFIATNTDATYPIEGGRFQPGGGSIVSAIQTASGQAPTIIGKPSPFMVHQICQDLQLQPAQVLIVGDRLDTDIAAGQNAGCPTWLVLTGVETELPNDQPGSQNLRALAEDLSSIPFFA